MNDNLISKRSATERLIIAKTLLETVLQDMPSGELIRCGECVHCADDWNGNQPMFTCELARCGESVYPNDYCSRAERRSDG